MNFDDYSIKVGWIMLELVLSFFFFSGIDTFFTEFVTVDVNTKIVLYIVISFIGMVYLYGYRKRKVRR